MTLEQQSLQKLSLQWLSSQLSAHACNYHHDYDCNHRHRNTYHHNKYHPINHVLELFVLAELSYFLGWSFPYLHRAKLTMQNIQCTESTCQIEHRSEYFLPNRRKMSWYENFYLHVQMQMYYLCEPKYCFCMSQNTIFEPRYHSCMSPNIVFLRVKKSYLVGKTMCRYTILYMYLYVHLNLHEPNFCFDSLKNSYLYEPNHCTHFD